MKTDDLIDALSADLPPARHLDRRLILWMIPAALVVLITVGLWLGYREDLMAAMRGPVFWAKAAYTIAMSVAGFWLLDRLGRPGASPRAPLILLATILVLVVGMALYELAVMPMPERMPAVMGDSAQVCAPNIALLSLLAAPFVFWAARAFAPTRPMLAGAAAGLLTGGLATTLYGLHCPEHAAAFVAVWYTIGMAVAVAGGALIGRLAFRW
ncbi:MAG: hypothetical protein B7Y86_10550 [Brevundimonas subvibrioides]|uniref:DUF1109 family protein n=1 Tax=Brevundimonas subvibrioides TaxID=74313 RepID=A0A258HGV3_9CAUL|nr:DUF1109 domain-containing protein [Brevundimonas subvibrioides]OYX56146.1 MAG: hypothetical protein B7Y86_10550 [Brevundimonas subvibrioides]